MNVLRRLAFASVISLLGCTGDGTGDDTDDGGDDTDDTETTGGACPSTVVATWDADGVATESSTSVFFALDTVFNVSLVGCHVSGPDTTVTLAGLPSPPVVGTWPLEDTLGFGGTGQPAASYVIGSDEGYSTGGAYTGTASITAVDIDASTFSGTFSFEADLLPDGGATVSITNGTLEDVPYVVVTSAP